MKQIEIEGKSYEVKEMTDWKTCIADDFKVGDYFDSKIAWELINCVPPENFSNGYFQCGEPYSHINGKQTYLTLVKICDNPEIWQFVGYCHSGQRKEPVEN